MLVAAEPSTSGITCNQFWGLSKVWTKGVKKKKKKMGERKKNVVEGKQT